MTGIDHGKLLPLDAAVKVLASADGQGSGQNHPVGERSTDLDAYRWRNRLVLIFTATADDPAFSEQRDALEAVTEGLSERHTVMLADTDPGAGGALRARFKAQGFEVLLVGKDGEVKLRLGHPVTAETLFGTIDAMPMRQREMK